MKLYGRGSIIVQTILMDMEFDSTKDELMGKPVVNNSAAKEHVAEIERCICTVKERCRAMASDLPFNFLHKTIVINLVYFWILWLNAFPAKKEFRKNSPPNPSWYKPSWVGKIIAALNLGIIPRSTMNPTLEIRSPHAPTQKLLSVPLVISMVPSIFCLIMGRTVKHHKFTRFTMPDRIIKKQTHGVRKRNGKYMKMLLSSRTVVKILTNGILKMTWMGSWKTPSTTSQIPSLLSF